MRLIIYAENGRDYVAAMHPPVKYKKKAMFFLKREPCALTNDNLHEQVIYGDSTETPLESLSSITKHVFMPLLSCPGNQDGWPDFLTKEVSESLHKFTASVFVAIGQMQGKTTLPLPAGAGPFEIQPEPSFKQCSISLVEREGTSSYGIRLTISVMLQISTALMPQNSWQRRTMTEYTFSSHVLSLGRSRSRQFLSLILTSHSSLGNTQVPRRSSIFGQNVQLILILFSSSWKGHKSRKLCMSCSTRNQPTTLRTCA